MRNLFGILLVCLATLSLCLLLYTGEFNSDSLIGLITPITLMVLGISLLRKKRSLDYNGKELASFRYRFLSVIIDGLIFGAPIYILWYISNESNLEVVVYVASFYSLVYHFIVVTLHYKYGKTPGKYFARIKVVREDNEKLTLINAFSRSSMELSLGIPTLIGTLYMFQIFKYSGDSAESYFEYLKWLAANNVNWIKFLTNVTTFYSTSEIWFIMLNKYKKAIHDYLAGTIVIREK